VSNIPPIKSSGVRGTLKFKEGGKLLRRPGKRPREREKLPFDLPFNISNLGISTKLM